MTTPYYNVPKSYRKNYAKVIGNTITKIAITFASVGLLLWMLVYFS